MAIPVAALYRVSTVKQLKDDEDDSIPVQSAVIRNFVAQHPEWELTRDREYSEEGVSAFKLSKDDRDILQHVIADAYKGKFKILLIFKADRLSRNSFEYPIVLWQLHRAGVDVIAVADAPGGKKLGVEDQFDKLIRFIEGWQAETESKNTSIRVTHAMREKARQGHWSGGRPPYGFKLSDSKQGLPLVKDEQESVIVKEMCRLYLEEGVGSKRIANLLNERGYRTREGKLWSDTRVRAVLQNPIICGLPAYDRTKPGNTPTSRVRIKGYTDLENFVIPRDKNGNPKPIPEYCIITLEEWQQLMNKMRRNAPAKKPGTPPPRAMSSGSLLTGFLVCGYCGRGFISSGCNWRKRNGKVYPYHKRVYRCITHARVGGGEKICKGQGSYSQQKIDRVFLQELQNFLSGLNPKDLLQYVEQKQVDYLASATNRIKALETELRKNKKVYNAWVKRLDEYFSDPDNSMYSEQLLAEKVREYGNVVSETEKELERVKSQARVEKHKRSQLMEFSQRAPQWFKLFMEAPVTTKKQMLAQIIGKVVLYRDKIEIHYNVDLAEFLGREERIATDQDKLELKVLATF